jgi:hypothetical protein
MIYQTSLMHNYGESLNLTFTPKKTLNEIMEGKNMAYKENSILEANMETDNGKAYHVRFFTLDDFKFYDPFGIKDINIIVPNKVVEVTFEGGGKQKSVCREPDVFSLEQAITICLCKQIMGGSGRFNRTVKHGLKVYDDKLKKAEEEKKEQMRIAKKMAKKQAYMARKKAKKELAERERAIEIQKEAYVRAMAEIAEMANKGGIAEDNREEVINN